MNDEIFDASAGTGLLAGTLLKKHGSFKKLVLNDPSSKMLARAKYRLRNYKNIDFTDQFLEDLSLKDQTFTQVICLNSFHYYTHQKDVLKNFRRILKPGGNLWILDWNRTGSFKITNMLIGWFTPGDINSRSLGEMQSLLNETGFYIQEKETWSYHWWNFFYVKCTPVENISDKNTAFFSA